MEYIDDIRALDLKIDAATARINEMVKESKTTLTRIYGVGPLNAALILGEVGNVGRFPTRNHFASYAGTAPIEVSYGDTRRHRLSRSGNRRLNRAIHIAAIVQIRFDCPGQEFYRRKISEGKSKKEAIRALKRHITDAVWRQLQVDRQHDQTQDTSWPRRPSTRRGNPSYRSPDTPRANGNPMRRHHDPTAGDDLGSSTGSGCGRTEEPAPEAKR